MSTKTKHSGRRPAWLIALISLGALFVIAVVVVVVARFTLYIPYKQPSASMYPAVLPGDLLFANGLDTAPARGAVMVFRYPEHRNQVFDKRVIGLPGDTVRTNGATVFVNDWEIPRCSVGQHSFKEPTGEEHAGELVMEYLGDAVYLIFLDEVAVFSHEGGPWHVANDQYFVLGDNRNNSHDSRMWFGGTGGGVPLTDTIGRVRGHHVPKLPPGAEALQPALEACLAKPAPQTSPPPPK